MKKALLFTISFISPTLFAEIHLAPLPLDAVGKVAQFDLNENGELFVINRQGELWQTAPQTKLADNLSTQIAPTARYGRIASGDKSGNFFLWTAEKSYTSTIPLAPNATMQPLAFATIAVTKQHGGYKLARIETNGNNAEIVALSADDVLPDARPLQVNFQSGDHSQGHIAVLAKPDSRTYQHGVLGDDLEAQEIQYLERHSLKPLADKIHINGLVFEANQLAVWEAPQPKIVSTMSGKGDGARAVVIGNQNGKLQIEAQSEPLPGHRWQSPFSFNGKLYAVQMPHLRMRLVEYAPQGGKLNERFIADGLSNHSYGEYETNLAVSTEQFALIPQSGYRSVAVLDKSGKLEKLSQSLPASIVKTKAGKATAYLLLDNGQVWVASEQ